jgi:competence protein ComEC
METLFVDVGFGTCNVILTGSGEAIVLDTGKGSQVPIALLNQFSVKRISHLIISHWHDDHFRGVSGLVRAFSGKIKNVWFPFDPAFQDTEVWETLCGEVETGAMEKEQLQPLTIDGKKPRWLWYSLRFDADLSVISPCYMENLEGVEIEDSNATCGILVLRVGPRLIVFGGDAMLGQWQRLPKRVPTPLVAEVLAVPHHAGIIWPPHWSDANVQKALNLLYTKIVQPRVAIISAGTRPGDDHPRKNVIEALRAVKSDVMCTQMTARCTSDLETSRKMQASLPLVAPGRSSRKLSLNKAKKSCHVACAGSVLVELKKTGATIHQMPSHQKFVNSIPNKIGDKPMCR